MEALWDVAPPPDPLASLRPHLSRLRDTLGADAVDGTAMLRLRLPDDAWVDVEEGTRRLAAAESAVAARRWGDGLRDAEAAARILRLPLLPGLDTGWLGTARTELDSRRTRALELVAAAALEVRPAELATAQHAARDVVERAPYHEVGHRLLIAALLAAGEAAEGLRCFHAVRTLFREELGIGPSPQLQDLHAALLVAGEDRPPAVGRRLPSRLRMPGTLIGRRKELAFIEERVRTGAPVLVTGEAGIGKTRLLAAAAAEQHARGATVLYGRCDGSEPAPYQGAVEAFDGVLDALGDVGLARVVARAGSPEPALVEVLLPGWRGAKAFGNIGSLPQASNTDLWRLHRAAQRFLDALGEDAPVLLCLDDLHDADPSTLLLLRHLAEHTGPRVTVLAGCRRGSPATARARPGNGSSEDPVAGFAGRVQATGGLLPLSGLARDELADLLRAAVRDDSPSSPGPDTLDALHAVTGGNPLHALQLARDADEVASDRAAEASGPPDGVPAGVREVVSRRVARLPARVQDILETAAVVGVEFDVDLLIRVAGRERSEVLDALDVCTRAGLLRESPGEAGRCAFVHGLIQRASYVDQPRSSREERHRRVAEALEERGVAVGKSALLAHHWFEAGTRADAQRLASHSRQAADHASSRLAFDVAAGTLRRALDACVEVLDPVEQIELLLALSRTERVAGELEAAREAARGAVERSRSVGDAERLARAALSFAGARTSLAVDAFDMPHAGESALLLLEAYRRLPAVDGALWVRLASELAASRLTGMSPVERRRLARQAARMAVRLGDRRGELLALQAEIAPSLCVPDGLDKAIITAERAVELARALHDPLAEWEVQRFLSGAAVVCGGFVAAEAHLDRMTELLELAPNATHELGLDVLRAGRARCAGRLGEAAEIRGHAIARSREPARAAAAFGAHGWMVDWDAGRYGDLTAAVEAVVGQAPQALPLHGLLALLYCEAARPEAAREQVRTLAADGFAFERDEFLLIGLTQTALACSYLGDRDSAAALHAALRPYAGRNAAIGEQGLTNGPVTLFLGALEVTLGRLDDAGRHLAEAARSARSWGDPCSGALVAVHRGRLLALQGRHEEGMALTRAAVAQAHTSGSERIAVVAAGLETWWPTPDPRPPGTDGGSAATF